MADVEMYDYLSMITSDVDVTLSVTPQNVITEFGDKNQIVHTADDGTEVRISLGDDTTWFYSTLQWPQLALTTDIGTVFDIYHDTAKANGIVNSFKWAHPTDGHTYVVRFEPGLERNLFRSGIHGIPSATLRVLGRIADA